MWCHVVWILMRKRLVMPSASKVKGSRTLEESCFYLECLTLEAEGIMVLWYTGNHLTDNMASHTRRPEPSAVLL